jgi:hypothetical protein
METSGQKTASCVITAAEGELHGLIISGLAAGAAVIDLFDNASAASGTRLVPQISFIASTDNERFKQIVFPKPLSFYNGIYLSMTTGAGTVNVNVYYDNND